MMKIKTTLLALLFPFLLFSQKYAVVIVPSDGSFLKTEFQLPQDDTAQALQKELKKEKNHATILNAMSGHGWKFRQAVQYAKDLKGATFYLYFEK